MKYFLSLFLIFSMFIFFISESYALKRNNGTEKVLNYEFDYVWDMLCDYMTSSKGPGLYKANIKKGRIFSCDIKEKKKKFFSLTNRNRKFFEVYLKPVNKNKTCMFIYANFLKDVDFDNWVQVKDKKNQRMFEKRFFQEFLTVL